MFGDYEPEDAYDAGDPPDRRLDNLRRRITALDGLPIRPDAPLAEIADRLDRFQQTAMLPAAELRAMLLEADLTTIARELHR